MRREYLLCVVALAVASCAAAASCGGTEDGASVAAPDASVDVTSVDAMALDGEAEADAADLDVAVRDGNEDADAGLVDGGAFRDVDASPIDPNRVLCNPRNQIHTCDSTQGSYCCALTNRDAGPLCVDRTTMRNDCLVQVWCDENADCSGSEVCCVGHQVLLGAFCFRSCEDAGVGPAYQTHATCKQNADCPQQNCMSQDCGGFRFRTCGGIPTDAGCTAPQPLP